MRYGFITPGALIQAMKKSKPAPVIDDLIAKQRESLFARNPALGKPKYAPAVVITPKEPKDG